MKNRKILSFSHSLKSSPIIVIDKYNQIHWGDFNSVFFLLYKLRLVVKVTYLTCLHRCRQESILRIKNPRPNREIFIML